MAGHIEGVLDGDRQAFEGTVLPGPAARIGCQGSGAGLGHLLKQKLIDLRLLPFI
jgi:hypothetical protein